MDGHDPKCANLRALPIDMNTNIKLYQEADVEITFDDDEADE